MPPHSIPPVFEDYEAETQAIRDIGTAGVVISFNYTFRGPEYFESTYPEAWQELYENEHFHMKDPVLMWSATHSGNKRWSEIKLPDMFGVLKHAAAHGLNFGATFSRFANRKRSVLSVSRSDREIDDQEMELLATIFDRLVDIVDGECGLTKKEKRILRALASSASQTEAANSLGIPLPTVKANIQSAKEKLGCSSTMQAVALAVHRRYISPERPDN